MNKLAILLLIIIIFACNENPTSELNDKPGSELKMNNSGTDLQSDFQIVELGLDVKLYLSILDTSKISNIENITIKWENESKTFSKWTKKDTLITKPLKPGWNTFYSKILYYNGNYSLDTTNIFITAIENIYTLPEKPIVDFSISNDCQTIVFSSMGNTYHSLSKYEISTKKLTPIPSLNFACAHYATFSPDDKFIISFNKGIIKTNIQTLQSELLIPGFFNYYPNCSFLPDGNNFLFCSDGKINRCDIAKKEKTLFEDFGGDNICVNKKGTFYALVKSDGTITLHNYNSKIKVKEFKLPLASPNLSGNVVTLSNDDQWLFSNLTNTLINLTTNKIYKIKTNKNRLNSTITKDQIDLGYMMPDNSGIIYSEYFYQKSQPTDILKESKIVLLKLKNFF